jgi:uncharacterized Rossmann fold enzyme
MRFIDWEPIYEDILEEFGFSREKDEDAARLLQSLLWGREGDLYAEDLESIIGGREVLVCGNGPSLQRELEKFLEELDTGEIAVIAADGATTAILAAGVLPDVIVTDLDGFLPDIIAANERGSAVVVHAHGDNIASLKEYVPRLTKVLGTTQSEPMEGVFNFGGFSDGDRCVFLARNFGASKIRIIGFDYDDPDVTFVKKMKLKWARRLVAMALENASTL